MLGDSVVAPIDGIGAGIIPGIDARYRSAGIKSAEMNAAVSGFDVVRQAFHLMLSCLHLLIECAFLDRCDTAISSTAGYHLTVSLDHVVAPSFTT
ncbi:hypothetical protein WI64_07995 [Burkholderia cepacia]|nr:hypothetical protein WI64_07995 [Burkholderia cepacia]